MTIVVNMHEAKTNLSALVAKAIAGEDVVIAKAGKPMVKLVSAKKGKRKLGLWKGKVKFYRNFNDPVEGFNEYFE